MCESGTTYASSTPTVDKNCAITTPNVFWTSNCTGTAVALNEFVNATDLRDRRYSTATTPPSQDFKFWASSFCVEAVPSNSSVPVFQSRLCLASDCSTALSLDITVNKACTNWDASVPSEVLVAQLSSIIADAVNALDDLQPLKPIQGGIGFGASSYSGTLAPLPVLELTYTNRTWHDYHYPDEVNVVPIQNPGDQCDTQVFPTITAYTAYLSSLLGKNEGRNGPLPGTRQEMTKMFGQFGDSAVSVVTDFWALYQLQLLNASNVRLSKFASRAINMLPPKYEMNPDLFAKFFTQFGTSYVVSGTGGGWVSQISSWKSWLPTMYGFTNTDLNEQAGVDFTSTTQWCGHQGVQNPTYTGNRATQLACGGGDPTLQCTDPNRKVSFITDPVPLDYIFSPVSELVTDASVRNAMQTATMAYLQGEDAEWQAFNKCPSSCTGARGTCSAPQGVSCTCQANFFGLMCSAGTGPWGSAFEVNDPNCGQCENGNLLTGGCSCPKNFASQSFRVLNDCSGQHGGNINVCWGGDSEYGGAFQVDDNAPGSQGCRSHNPYTQGCSCLPGFTASPCLRTLVDVNAAVSDNKTNSNGVRIIGSCIFTCENLSAPPTSFGGSYQVTDYNTCMANNLRTGGCGCPSGFRPQPLRTLVDRNRGASGEGDTNTVGANIYTCSL